MSAWLHQGRELRSVLCDLPSQPLCMQFPLPVGGKLRGPYPCWRHLEEPVLLWRLCHLLICVSLQNWADIQPSIRLKCPPFVLLFSLPELVLCWTCGAGQCFSCRSVVHCSICSCLLSVLLRFPNNLPHYLGKTFAWWHRNRKIYPVPRRDTANDPARLNMDCVWTPTAKDFALPPASLTSLGQFKGPPQTCLSIPWLCQVWLCSELAE